MESVGRRSVPSASTGRFQVTHGPIGGVDLLYRRGHATAAGEDINATAVANQKARRDHSHGLDLTKPRDAQFGHRAGVRQSLGQCVQRLGLADEHTSELQSPMYL